MLAQYSRIQNVLNILGGERYNEKVCVMFPIAEPNEVSKYYLTICFVFLPFLLSWPSEAQRVVVLSLFSKPLMEIVLVQMSFVDQGSKERVISSLFLIRYNYVFNSMYSLVEGCSC